MATSVSMVRACARGSLPVGNSVLAPLLAAVTDHIYQRTDLSVEEAKAQANTFITWNAKRGWDCLPDWKLAADLWVARIECPRG